MKLYTVEFKSGSYFTIFATHFKKVTPDEPAGIPIPKMDFFREDSLICSVPLAHIEEIYTLSIFGREVVYHG